MSSRLKELQSTSEMNTEVECKILVAVDFGTTYSGLAWSQTRKPEVQTPIIQWPDANSGGLEGMSNDKVPTEIQYDGQNFKWGYQIPDFGQRHQWFKLELDSTQSRGSCELARKFPDPMAAPPGYNTSPEQLAKDYLMALRMHAEQILRYKLPASALQSTPIEYVITVPAVWSDAAQAKTRACAEQAGMGTGSALHIISEPEAAAMYALDAMDPHHVKVGDTFVLCDAGGGTVDLISYKVSALRPILEIEEASPGIGLLCGSSFLNRIFQQNLTAKLGLEREWDEEVLEHASKHFELFIKRQFRGTAGEQFKIPVPGLRDDAALHIRRGILTLDGHEIKAVFDPVVNEVLKLVKDQIKAAERPIKAILMVGGFGQSAYLRDCIRQAVGDVEVMQSPNGWTAVVRGALMKGLASTSSSFATVGISGRRARKCYGMNVSRRFRDEEHDKSRRYWSAFKGRYEILLMAWFIKKGAVVQEDQPFQLGFYEHHYKSFGPPTTVICPIYCFSDRENTGAPGDPNASGIIHLVDVKADLNLIPEHLFPQKTGANGEVAYRINYEIEVTYFSAYTECELVYDGVNYGAVAVEYV